MNKKILFIDLDGTIIKTNSGKVFPTDVTDFKFRKEVLDKIKTIDGLKYIFIVTNQGGIPEYVKKLEFETKLKAIKVFVAGYCGVTTYAMYCDSIDKSNPRRKPNTGMLEDAWSWFDGEYDKSQALMIGDASGKLGDFSNSDLQTAMNFGIDYIDVEEFINAGKS